MSKAGFAGETQLVIFKLGQEEYGVDILSVQEIIKMVEFTRLPNLPDFVEGVINLRGKIIPVIDLRKRFNLPPKDHTEENRIVVIDVNNTTIGMIVDGVSEVLRLTDSTVEPTPAIISSVDTEYLKGVGKLEDRLLILLDIEKIFSMAQQEQLNNLANAS